MGDHVFKITISVLVIGILGAAMLFGGGDSEDQSHLSNHTAGNANSKIELVEYADFQCAACLRYYPVINQVKEKYKDKINFRFKHFPLTQIHPNTMAAHRAAEAASNQGKFWEMHDLLYENQKIWEQSNSPISIFESYAEELSLDLNQFRVDRDSAGILSIINADSSEGKKAGATGTPTFAINGKIIDSPEPTLEAFSRLIDPLLK